MKRKIGIVSLIIVTIIFCLVLAATYQVEMSVRETCQIVQATYGGSLPEALIKSAEINFECNQSKSRALWAMGQLGDESVLTYLKENYGHLEKTDICIFEAQFAIEKLEKNLFNIPGLLWRWTWM